MKSSINPPMTKNNQATLFKWPYLKNDPSQTFIQHCLEGQSATCQLTNCIFLLLSSAKTGYRLTRRALNVQCKVMQQTDHITFAFLSNFFSQKMSLSAGVGIYNIHTLHSRHWKLLSSCLWCLLIKIGSPTSHAVDSSQNATVKGNCPHKPRWQIFKAKQAWAIMGLFLFRLRTNFDIIFLTFWHLFLSFYSARLVN